MKQLAMEKVGDTKYGLQDYVPTPTFCVDALVSSGHPPPPDVTDPFAGDGAILRRLVDHHYDPSLMHAVEMRDERDSLDRLGLGSVTIGDWFQVRESMGRKCPACGTQRKRPRVRTCPVCERVGIGWIGWPTANIVTNVPWSILERAVVSCLETDGRGAVQYVASLQPMEELGGVARCGWLKAYCPTAIVSLMRRPFPRAARGCCWMIWEYGVKPIDLEIR